MRLGQYDNKTPKELFRGEREIIKAPPPLTETVTILVFGYQAVILTIKSEILNLLKPCYSTIVELLATSSQPFSETTSTN